MHVWWSNSACTCRLVQMYMHVRSQTGQSTEIMCTYDLRLWRVEPVIMIVKLSANSCCRCSFFKQSLFVAQTWHTRGGKHGVCATDTSQPRWAESKTLQTGSSLWEKTMQGHTWPCCATPTYHSDSGLAQACSSNAWMNPVIEMTCQIISSHECCFVVTYVDVSPTPLPPPVWFVITVRIASTQPYRASFKSSVEHLECQYCVSWRHVFLLNWPAMLCNPTCFERLSQISLKVIISSSYPHA